MKKRILTIPLLLFTVLGFGQCPANIVGFGSQEDLIDFASQYPNCEFAYTFIFAGNEITDFSPLSYIDRVNHVEFRDIQTITNFETFDITITSSLAVKNCNFITNLSGLNLDSDNLNFLWVWLRQNDQLNSLNGINTDITIDTEVRIIDNPNLPFCAIQPFCEAIANPDVEVFIYGNASGCESVAEVAAACELSITESSLSASVHIYPNPAGEKLYILLDSFVHFEFAEVYSVSGQKLMQTKATHINISNLSAGIYFVKVISEEGSITKKIIKK
ncbi:T9SS type A sorting domain-containing protein [Rasiella rasia]|uniref:T9SS type A sorting domain-containing protein n=1 Tax=Rasiella rasia TaxID=2744027 RepID=A0A6G6GP50_9FLAO|nr:T9SS type A sorting domain-containing protein [Rasiella rasia]QIE60356.1 T9SS type A sorting domain-containing protein [Rasiella rasia]